MIDTNNRIKKVTCFYENSRASKYVYECLECKTEILKTAYEEKGDGLQYCKLCVVRYKRTRRKELDENGNKKCKACLRALPLDKFLKNKKRNIYSACCSKCHNLKKFGINSIEYENLLLKQNGKCAICEKEEKAFDPFKGMIRDLAVDHCHKKGNVRGLLCTNCNTSLGGFKDDMSLLKKAYFYLKNQLSD